MGESDQGENETLLQKEAANKTNKEIKIKYNRTPQVKYILPVRNICLLLSSILIPLFPPFVAHSDKSGWDHVVGKFASTTHLLLRKSLCLVKLCLSYSDVHYRHPLQNATLHRVFLLQKLSLQYNMPLHYNNHLFTPSVRTLCFSTVVS